METIRVVNLRSIADSTTIEIKPISLLVGANSSGKSTFLRSFALLRQSHEMRSLGGLVLNEGDVNFGFFNEVLHKDANPPELKIEFGFTLQHGLFQGAQWNKYLSDPMEAKCELTYAKRAKDQRYPRLRSVLLTLASGETQDSLEIAADDDGRITKFRVNGLLIEDSTGSLRLRISRGLIPRLELALEKDDSESNFRVVDPVSVPFDKRLLKETDSFFHGRTSQESRLATFHGIPIGPPKRMLELMRTSGARKWQERVQKWNEDSPAFRKVRDLLLAARMNDLLGSVSAYETQLARSVNYFAPVRASVERDYLSRDVSITAVDPSGINVAMVLASMPPSAIAMFRQWTGKYFGFEVFPQGVGDGARVALRMKDVRSGTEFNLADTGFGYSQMLPFLVQIWSITEGRKLQQRNFHFAPNRYLARSAVPTSYLIAIEQPELHLHPALQARLADVFVAMAKLSREQGPPIRFMLETHSPSIIERIGQLVEVGEIAKEDVQVILFEPDAEQRGSNTSKVRAVSFNSEGVLEDWPFGFLAAPVLESQVKGQDR